ncbi:MAG: LysM peptidoglycan-binding domain-containing protein [Planctomycetota bacterium]
MKTDRWVTAGLAGVIAVSGWSMAGCAVREPLPSVPGPASLSSGGGFDPIEVPADDGPESAGMDEGPAAEDPVVVADTPVTQSVGHSTEPNTAASASEVATPARTYTIRKGDRLWKIAQEEYGDGQRWVDILEANPGLNPERMTVGDEIVLPE